MCTSYSSHNHSHLLFFFFYFFFRWLLNADLPFSVCLLSGSALLFAIMTHVVPFRSFLLTTLHVCQGRRERKKKKKREAEVQQFWRLDAGCKLHCCSTHSWTELLFFFSPQQHAAPALPHRVLRFKRSSAYAGGEKKKKEKSTGTPPSVALHPLLLATSFLSSFFLL